MKRVWPVVLPRTRIAKNVVRVERAVVPESRLLKRIDGAYVIYASDNVSHGWSNQWTIATELRYQKRICPSRRLK